MKKKFMKVALFGVLTLTAGASFVGCKDYDDDISGLNEALAATKSDLTSKETALKASIASLEAAKVDVAAVLASAKTESDKAALKAKEDAIASSLASMKAIEADLQAKIAANTSDIKILNEQVLAADKAFAALSGEVAQIQKMLLGYEGLVETVGKLQSADTRLETEITTLSDTMKKSIEDLQGQITAVTTQIGVLGEGETVAGELSKLLAELNTQKEALTKAATKEELATANGLIAGNTQKIQELSTKIDLQLNVLKSLFRSLVTGINFVEGGDFVLNMTTAETDKDKVFGEGLTGAITFKKGDKYTYNAAALIQVSPSTANISSDMITLVRSDGESLSNDLVIVTVEPFNDAITQPATRGASKGGLWKVSVKLNPTYDQAAFTKFVKKGTDNYLFAVAAKDVAAEGEDERIVASPYKLTFASGNYAPMTSIATSTVNGTAITALPSPALPIEIGKAINVKVKGDNTGVRASYIVLDGTAAEKLEWRKYGITGVDQVLEANEFNLNIANGNADGKTVKFKVYAIDFAGKVELTETFSVVCGKQNATAPKLNVTLQPSSPAASTGNYDMPKAIAMTSALATTDEDAKNLVGGSYVIEFKTADGTAVMTPTATFHKADGKEVTFNAADAATIKTITAVKLAGIDLQKIANNSSIVGKIIFKNANGLEVLVVPVTLTKEMPAFPATFSAKSGLLNNGVIKVYPSYGADGKSTYEYIKIFNGLVAAGNDNFTIGYANNENEGSKVNFNSIPDKAYTAIAVDNKLVGSQYAKAIPTMVKFNYGAISSIKDASGAYINWAPVWGTAFALKFGSIPEESKLTVKTVDIAYPAETATIAKTAITYPSVVDKSNLGLEVKDDKANDIAAIALKTVSKENGAVNEYYTATLSDGSIKFTKVSDQASLKSDVASKLVITITDVFGNKFDTEFAFTVKANQ